MTRTEVRDDSEVRDNQCYSGRGRGKRPAMFGDETEIRDQQCWGRSRDKRQAM
jgi:hypothetical protein